MQDDSHNLQATELHEVTVEQYFIGRQYFTRTLLIPRGGGSCDERFTIGGQTIANAKTWLEAIAEARRQASS